VSIGVHLWLSSSPLPVHILSILIGIPKLFIGGQASGADESPQPTVNNFAAAAKSVVNNLLFTAKKVNTLGPEDEWSIRNVRRLLTEFRSGPSAVTPRNPLEPFARIDSLRRRTTIRSSHRHGPRVQKPN
jgi:hypothetical protein